MTRTAVALALVLGLSACGPDAAPTEDAATNDATTSAPATSGTSEGDDTAADGGEASGDDPDDGTTSADAGGTSEATTTGRATEPTPAASTAPEPTSPPAAPGAPGTPAGTYTSDVEGTTQVGAFSPQPYRGSTQVAVEAVRADGTQRATTSGQLDEGSNPRGFDEQRTVRHTQTEVLLARLVTQGTDGEIEFVLDPPELFAPLTAEPGRTWSWTMTSSDGATTADTTVTVRPGQTVTVGGQRVDALVLDATITFTSDDFEGTQTLRTWSDPERRLIVRSESHLEGRFRLGDAWVPLVSDETRVLRHLDPR